jgi:para-nitrobenzyl esterase
MTHARTIAAGVALALSACTTVDGGESSAGELAGTSWRLAELQTGPSAERPADTSRYTMQFAADGSVALQLDCNRATGGWRSPGRGQLSFTPLAMTRAMCPPGSFDTRIAGELGEVRSYALVGDRLTLTREGGGSIVWVRPSIQPTPR